MIFLIFRCFCTLRFSNIVQTIHQWNDYYQMMYASQFQSLMTGFAVRIQLFWRIVQSLIPARSVSSRFARQPRLTRVSSPRHPALDPGPAERRDPQLSSSVCKHIRARNISAARHPATGRADTRGGGLTSQTSTNLKSSVGERYF